MPVLNGEVKMYVESYNLYFVIVHTDEFCSSQNSGNTEYINCYSTS